jgi:hypothetical protein
MGNNQHSVYGNKGYILRIGYAVIILFSVGLMSCNEPDKLIRVVDMPQYASGSSIERFNDRLYLMGDDAPQAMVLNLQLQVTDSISLFEDTAQRIPKSRKADIESGGVFSDSTLVWMGSGSKKNRNRAILYHLITRDTQHLSLDTFFYRLSLAGIPSLNIEGMAVTPQQVILANRGNGNHPVNQLIFVPHNFWKRQERAGISIVKTGFQPASVKKDGVEGLSGLAYSTQYDRLFATVSTESSADGVTDGAIGNSYLWIFDDISPKRTFTALNPSKIIALADIDPRLKNQKIESVALLEENKRSVRLALTADNDDGTTRLFEVEISNKPPERKGSNFWDL